MRGNKLFRYIDYYIGIPIVAILGLISKFISKFAIPPTYGGQLSNILVIKLAALGDTILLWPVLRAIKRKLNPISISMIVTTINIAAINTCPYIGEKILFDIKSIFNPFRMIKFVRYLQRKKFDLVIDFDQWLRISPIIGFLSGAKIRVGFMTDGQHKHYLYTSYVHHERKKHELDCFFDILKCLGIDSEDRYLEFLTDTTQNTLPPVTLLTSNLVAFHPGMPRHGWQRQWPKEKFIQLGQKLIGAYGCKIVLIGAIYEKKLITEIAAAIGETNTYLVIGLQLSSLAEILKKCRVVVCGNTGIMHLACAVNVPVVALHGPTDERKWGPIGEKHTVIRKKISCSPCLYLGFEYKCKKNVCMELITIDEVYASVKRYLTSQ